MIPLHTAPMDWPGATVVIIASGPSTERVDLTLIKGLPCIAVSNGFRAKPDADVFLAGGMAFWKLNDLSQFASPILIITKNYAPWAGIPTDDGRLVYMDRAGPEGLTDIRTALCGSESSVTLAINYAVHRGAARIILLGCDGQPSLDGRRRVNCNQADHKLWPVRYAAHEAAMATQIGPLAERGVGIVNCSPGSALGCYRRVDLADAIAAI